MCVMYICIYIYIYIYSGLPPIQGAPIRSWGNLPPIAAPNSLPGCSLRRFSGADSPRGPFALWAISPLTSKIFAETCRSSYRIYAIEVSTEVASK